MTETVSGALRQSSRHTPGLRIERVFTTEGVHPYDEVDWERRDVVLTNWRDGSINFEQRGVEFPSFYSVNASNIVTSKYFRGAVGTEQRESSLRQIIDRVVNTYTQAGLDNGYFSSAADAEVFDHELKHLLVHQYFSFNSPVWFNVGTTSPQFVSACFILAVDDTIDSILDWYKEEGLIFKGGSGAGVNLSRIRSSKELLSSGGTASGPVSFMRGADASAGTIKSGGATRRAAKMVVLDVDHPDIEEFVELKTREENKIRALRDAGFDMDLGGEDITSVQYQNANNSVRVSDAFMRAVEEGKDFDLTARQDGRTIKTVDARELFGKIAGAAWSCADPGLQYDDTINDWHTNPESGRITASNPCFPADQRVVTDKGLVRIGDMVARAATGEHFGVYTNDVTSEVEAVDRIEANEPVRYMVTGTKEILELRFSDGSRLRCTPNHRIWTRNGWVRAEDLASGDRVMKSLQPAARTSASWAIPEHALQAARDTRTLKALDLPEKWSEELGHYLGWMVGDGCVTKDAAVTVYGSAEEQEALLPVHLDLIEQITGHRSKPSVQSNGTQQLRVHRDGVLSYLLALGLSNGRSSAKVVPEAVFEAPQEAMVAFLRGLYDADGCVVDQTVKGTRYVGLGSRSEELLLGVQELLASLGIRASLYETGTKTDSFSYTRKDGSVASYSSDGPSFDLRISGRSIAVFQATVGFGLQSKAEKLARVVSSYTVYQVDETVGMVSRESTGFETTYNLTEPRNHSYIVSGVVVANCSEYLSLDNSSCNLASLNLMKFREADGTFNAKLFAKAVELVITAMDISICFADFPTEKIGQTTRDFRQLGIGYCNLGALLMAGGLAYDSEGGRALAGSITSLMTGTAYKRSAELAGVVGPYAGFAQNASAHARVMRKHAAANDAVRPLHADDTRVLHEATKAWQECLRIGEKNGWRNAQSSVLAPTGTISFFMDADTTGVEPDLALVKFKKLVGGASMQIVNRTVPMALRKLGYAEETVEAIVEHIAERGAVEDAPGLRTEHLEVFDCAMGTRSISWMGHVRMLAATQPFLSGTASKTVNLPEEATVEDIEKAYFEAWKLGLKALAVYRNNSKVGQPLSDKNDSGKGAEVVVEYRPSRTRLPKKRRSQTVSFAVAGAEGYLTAGEYDDGTLGEVFIKMSKQGSTLAGVMDAFSVSISIGLQYGVPLEAFVSKFTNMRFDPAGMTDDADIRIAQSVMDYLFRRLALDYLPYETRSALGIFSAEERAATVAGSYGSEGAVEDDVDIEGLASSVPVATPVAVQAQVGSSTELLEAMQGGAADAPLCMGCGVKMRPAGSCYVCESCGSTSGCS